MQVQQGQVALRVWVGDRLVRCQLQYLQGYFLAIGEWSQRACSCQAGDFTALSAVAQSALEDNSVEAEGRAGEQNPLRKGETRTAWGAGAACRLKLTQGKCTHWTQVCARRDEPQEAWLKLGGAAAASGATYLLTFTDRGAGLHCQL